MMKYISELRENNPGRLAGLFYLAVFVLAMVGAMRFVITPTVSITQDVLLIAQLGVVAELTHLLFFLLLGWALYVLFAPVDKQIALIPMLAIVVSVAIQTVNILNYLTAQSLLTGSEYLTVFSTEQIQSLATLYLQVHTGALDVAEFAWVLWMLAAGYLSIKSTFIPKYIAGILFAGAIGYIFAIIVFYLLPTFAILDLIGSMLAAIGEIGFMIWLLVKGTPISRETKVSS